MNSSLYIGATGLKGLAEGMNVIGNNVANMNTVAYKQQSIQFSDIYYASQGMTGSGWNSQENSRVALGQTGMGLQVDSIRTLFTQGALESSNTVTDIAIAGKGFFQVTGNSGEQYYTRAGNFRFDSDGTLKDPNGYPLSGIKLANTGSTSGSSNGALEPVKIDFNNGLAAKASTAANISMNLGITEDRSVNADNPYFSLIGNWNESSDPPLATSAYGYSESIKMYDAEGNAHTATIYLDGTPSHGGGKTLEYLLAEPGSSPPVMLMSGTLEFDSAGQLTNMTAFTPTGDDSSDLASWTPAALANGLPQFNLNGQAVTLNLGVTSNNSSWVNAPKTAADVGSDRQNLPSMGEYTRSTNATTGYAGSSTTTERTQDGYTAGSFTNMYIDSSGTVTASYSNGQNMELYSIPIFRFVSEDGLIRQGNNLFSAGQESGVMAYGTAGTENYGQVCSNNLETSNVDLASEMANMIIDQRGFQSNSKVITTADAMLQKAMELKR